MIPSVRGWRGTPPGIYFKPHLSPALLEGIVSTEKDSYYRVLSPRLHVELFNH
jgi:hypothetical protein